MVAYLTSYNNQEFIQKAIEECEEHSFFQKVENEISLLSFTKMNLDQINNVDIIIIDLLCLKDKDDEILQSLNTIRMLYDNIKIIILATSKAIGDPLLSEIFSLGIYNIVMFDILNEVLNCIRKGKTYKDSIQFKDSVDGNNLKSKTKKNSSTQMVEKVVIKNEIQKTVNKALIGYVGTQERIGLTHNVIVSAKFLKKQGYKIAILENSQKQSKCFENIKEFYEIESQKDYFCLNEIDFYPDFSLQDIPKVLIKNYNLVLIDFGLYSETNLSEFDRCVKQIIVTGSKAWEMNWLNQVFESQEEIVLKNYIYLFNFTELTYAKNIRDSMGELKNVYFTEYTPDPINSNGFEELKIIFNDYLNENQDMEMKKSSSFLRRMNVFFKDKK